MKKEEVKNLQDEFSSVFRGQQNQQSLSLNSDSNLLDSNQPSQKGTFKRVPLSESESEEDFMDQVDDLFDHTSEDQQLTRREIMMNFKMNQLKLVCRNLKQANAKLAERVEELQRVCSESENTADLNRTQDLTMMQQEFTEIEEELTRYKEELARHQKHMETQLTAKNEELRRARQEISQLRSARDAIERELRERGRVISLLEQRNEELLLTIEELQATQEPHVPQSISSLHFNDQISHQMESMIDKLLKELKYQKKANSNHLAEIKRLNSQIISLENKLKEKNNKIYELELAAIKLTKSQHQYNSPRKIDTERQEPATAYLPQRNFIGVNIDVNKNKTQSSLRNNNKNRMTAEREGGSKHPHAPLLPLNKVFSTFTLMDLLNKQFKIRTAEKYFIASRVVQLYADKLTRGDYDNLIPQEIEIYNFSSQSPSQLRVRVNAVSRSDRYQANEESLLYNMAFVLDTLLNQVQVVDAYMGTILELNIPDYIELVLGKPSKQQKQKLLIELATSIEREYLTD